MGRLVNTRGTPEVLSYMCGYRTDSQNVRDIWGLVLVHRILTSGYTLENKRDEGLDLILFLPVAH